MASCLVELARSVSARALAGTLTEEDGCPQQVCDAQDAADGGEQCVTQDLSKAPERGAALRCRRFRRGENTANAERWPGSAGPGSDARGASSGPMPRSWSGADRGRAGF